MTVLPVQEGNPLEWAPAPDEECTEDEYTFAPDGAEIHQNRIRVRMKTHALTDDLAEFAVIQQTMHRGKWRNVAAADSCHVTAADSPENDGVHVHYYAKSTDQRTGMPDPLMDVASQAELNDGYDRACQKIADDWARNLERWQHA